MPEQENTETQKPLRILSMDGGGVTALVTVRMLQQLQEAKPDYLNSVELFAGTSAGAINALILAQYCHPADGLDSCASLWCNPRLFSTTPWNFLLGVSGLAALASVRNFTEILAEYIDPDLTMAELKQGVLVTTFRLNSPRSIDSHHNEGWSHHLFSRHSTPDQKVLDVALRATALPAVLPIHKAHIDGGVFGVSPAMTALTATLHHLDEVQKEEHSHEGQSEEGIALDVLRERGFQLLSVGTGHHRQVVPVANNCATNWGFLNWSFPLPANNFTPFLWLWALLDAPEDITDSQMRNLFRGTKWLSYHRLDPNVLEFPRMYYVAGSFVPFVKQRVIAMLEQACVDSATQKAVKETVDWLVDKEW